MVFPDFNPDEEFQTFHDIDGMQIITINTDDTSRYLEKMRLFFEENKPYIDKDGISKIIQVYFKLPPMTAILSYMEMKIPEEFKWTAVAIIEPEIQTLAKFKSTIEMVVNALLTTNKNKYALKIFDNSVLKTPDEISKWLDDEVTNRRNEGSVQ